MSAENCLVKAIYSFKGKNNDELCFKKGDIITVTQKEEGGWWEGTLGETTGWFPSNYVTEYKDALGSQTTSPIRAVSEIQAFRNVVLKDIIDSEKAHVAEMQGLVTNFLLPLEKSDMLTRDEFKQLTGNIIEVLKIHEQFLTLLEDCATKTGPDQRVGGLFLQWAPKIKSVHQLYCAGHPKAVCILDKYKEELNSWMENNGAVCPGVLVLTAGLSKPFRRLSKYPAMLQELARHVHEAHPDRGDTHRASVVYKDIACGCSAIRRQKELELQVVTGEVRGWPGGELASLGDVLHMGSVAVGPSHQDRYLVLFPSALLLLSVSKRVSAFVYEGCLPLTGIAVCKLEDCEARKNAFEISGPMIDTIAAVCQTKAEADNWVSLLRKHSSASGPAHEPSQPSSLPHLARSPSEGALSSISNSRRSLYRVTLPPPTYPSASPYYSLTKYFAKLVRKKVITRQMLRKLLHERTWVKALESSGLPVKRRHRNRLKLRIGTDGTVDAATDSSAFSSEEDSSADAGADGLSKMLRQNAIDSSGSCSGSSWGSSFGYVKYLDASTDIHLDGPKTNVVGDCTRLMFDSNRSPRDLRDESDALHRPTWHIHSDGNSSFEARDYMACEDLVHMDEDAQFNALRTEETDFVPTRRSFPDRSARGDVHRPCKSTEESCRPELDYGSVMADLLKVLDPPPAVGGGDGRAEAQLIDPPPMFRNDDTRVSVISVALPADVPFRKHSINSDKKLRRSMPRSMLETEQKSHAAHLRRMSSQSDGQKHRKKCECCNRSLCPSPRSSDSGVAGSCNLASPELNLPDYSGSANPGLDSAGRGKRSPHNYCQSTSDNRKLSVTEAEAAAFEAQCRCTSPFGSTARTSCVTSVTSESSLDTKDSANSIRQPLSTFAANPPLSASDVKRTSIRRNIELYVPEIKLKPEVPPRLYRKPSTHLEVAKNVRQPYPGQWSTLNITERCKPSLHYHMRIYREECGERAARRERVAPAAGCGRARSEERRGERAGFVVYRSDLYAHWWMKAKLPITMLSDSGKDHACKMAMSESSSELAALTNHKRSHSFNNHQSYAQHTQAPKSKHKEASRRLPNSCDSLHQPAPNKFCSGELTDAAAASPSRGWSVEWLRPAPPLRPQASAGGGDSIGACHPYAPHQRKANSYEEDALILKVVEAYCTSARCRHALSSECEEDSPSLPAPAAASLWSVVLRLQSQLSTLSVHVQRLQRQAADGQQQRPLPGSEASNC